MAGKGFGSAFTTNTRRTTSTALGVVVACTLSSVFFGLSACSLKSSSTSSDVQRYSLKVLGTSPWDPTTFTEGLDIDARSPHTDPTFVVSAGLEGQSRAYTTNLKGATNNRQELDARDFGEGIAWTPQQVWQLTWKSGVAIKRDPTTLRETGTATFTGEGWGLCSDGKSLLMSNGSSTITRRDPTTFAETGHISVTLEGKPVTNINELDCSGGRILANKWKSTDIYQIDPTSGKVTAILDGSKLHTPDPQYQGEDVLNGIVSDPTDQSKLYLSGKFWSQLFHVQMVRQD